MGSDGVGHEYNHSAEVTIAAYGDRVVVASVNLHLSSATSYDIPTDGLTKRVVVNVSSDGGKTFGEAVDPQLGDGTFLGDQTTDPVIRASADGQFFLSVLRSTQDGAGAIGTTVDGMSWGTFATPVVVDKPWIAVDDAARQVFVGSAHGFGRYGFDGVLQQEIATPVQPLLMADAYADPSGAHFAVVGLQLATWDGSAAAPVIEPALDAGPDAIEYTTIAWSHGPLSDGSWSVYARRTGGNGAIIVRTQQNGSVTESPLTDSNAVAFMPAAAIDSSGRLHIAWYDSAGTTGVVKYAHSLSSAPFASGFSTPRVLDPNATPGAGWYPGFDTSSGARRLREYIGIAVDGERIHVAWTHSPSPPSRVYATTVDASLE